MIISRRDFFLSGSADGAPKASARSNACATLTDTYQVHFTNAVSFANSDLPFVVADDFTNMYFGCSNQISSTSEGLLQEMFVSATQIVSASQSCSKGYIRTLRLHLSIPHDTSGTQINANDVFYIDDASNPGYPRIGTAGSGKLFSGEIIVTDPSAPIGQDSWAYTIIGGSIQVRSEYNPVGLLPLELTSVIAKASAAGSGNNGAYASGGQVEMNGTLPILFEALTTYVDGTV